MSPDLPDSVDPAADKPLAPGCMLHRGRCRVERLLEPRGCLRAYKATQTASSHPVLLLELPGGASEEGRDRFLDTPRRLTSLGRPGLPQALDAFEEVGRALTVWSVTPGQSLDQWVRLRSLGVEDIVRHLERLIVAIDGCHRVGCLHLGLNCRWVTLSPAGDLVIPPPIPPPAGGPCGAASEDPYLAPELSRGYEPTPATDVYAIGALLHLMMFGRPPPCVAEQPAEDQTPNSSDRRHSLDPGLVAACLAALDADPARRPTLADLAQAARAAGSTRTAALTPLRTNRPWSELLASPLAERISAEPQAPRSELGWRADRLRWARSRAHELAPARHTEIEGALSELLRPVKLSHPTSGAASEWGCLAVLVAVFVWFSGVVAALGSVSAMALVLGSAAALAALAGVVLTISLWHRRRIRSAAEAICDRYTAPSERDDAIAVLYEMRESSLAAGEVLEALEVQRQKRSDKTL